VIDIAASAWRADARRDLKAPRDAGGDGDSYAGAVDGLRVALPERISACLFDLDGVLTRTATIHAAAWKEMFEDFLLQRAGREHDDHEDLRPVKMPSDYVRYIDGKLRSDGVRSFLESRRIALPEGSADDPPTAETVHGLAGRKNALVVDLLERNGVDVYEGSIRFVEVARDAGLRCAVVSASKNTGTALAAARISHLFEVRIDGEVAEQRGLRGKPAPDTFLAAARALDTPPEAASVFEDAEAGVEAGRGGGFGYVVGVDRVGNADALRERGADIVVADLSELLVNR
jgi:beta-phosphoglucomutase family hydrolase